MYIIFLRMFPRLKWSENEVIIPEIYDKKGSSCCFSRCCMCEGLMTFFCLNFRDGIVTWIKKKTGPGVVNITTLDDAERISTSENKVVLGYLSSLVVCFCISSIS